MFPFLDNACRVAFTRKTIARYRKALIAFTEGLLKSEMPPEVKLQVANIQHLPDSFLYLLYYVYCQNESFFMAATTHGKWDDDDKARLVKQVVHTVSLVIAGDELQDSVTASSAVTAKDIQVIMDDCVRSFFESTNQSMFSLKQILDPSAVCPTNRQNQRSSTLDEQKQFIMKSILDASTLTSFQWATEQFFVILNKLHCYIGRNKHNRN